MALALLRPAPARARRDHLGTVHSLSFNFRADSISADFIRYTTYLYCQPVHTRQPFPDVPIPALLPIITPHSGMRFLHVPKYDDSPGHQGPSQPGVNLPQRNVVIKWLDAITSPLPTPQGQLHLEVYVGIHTTSSTFRPAALFSQSASCADFMAHVRSELRTRQCMPSQAAKLAIANPCHCNVCSSQTPNHNTLSAILSLIHI